MRGMSVSLGRSNKTRTPATVSQPIPSAAIVHSAVTPIAIRKPTTRANAARRARLSLRCTNATARAESGPNYGPSTMAPAMITVESVTTPIAVSKQASVRNIRNVTLITRKCSTREHYRRRIV